MKLLINGWSSNGVVLDVANLTGRSDTHAGDTTDHRKEVAEKCVRRQIPRRGYSARRRSRRALPITETELRLIAALAIIGLSSSPKNGYSTPAASGMPTTL